MNYLGIDVSKTKIDCCLFINEISGKKKTKVFSNNEIGFNNLINWFTLLKISHNDLLITLEATGIYHENLCYFLHDAGCTLALSNPFRARRFAQSMSILNKTDKADSEVLAKYGAFAHLKIWKPDSENIKFLKHLIARRDAVYSDLLRENNRLEKSTFNHTSIQVINMIKNSIDSLQSSLLSIDEMISDLIEQDRDLKSDLDLLQSIPAIGKRTGLLMLNLFHSHQFDTASQAAAYVGLVPLQRQSGTSVRGASRLSKTGSTKIRSSLYMAAVVAIRHNPHVKVMYDRLLKNGKAKMAALCAAMRKLIHICYGVLKNKTPYHADFLQENS
ncbi:IS110 family transposase [Acinetobacter qingfengensis]|uniref:IS110 family transposase n=1 Tax=Acinetobacter qingfengensis TaxID=1262585 RepID=A0A1E7QYW6_9GAMM|nr:IS110 family transposase [Acinetobacter qingfengensis]KAA8733116.1 IS110 family transposase [Acinetobacter qingfengensis]OEY92265.1 IS110 family transposase [Acinetobacter qingfengensis]